jgi:nucleoside-diphosphate-sugar epimerase
VTRVFVTGANGFVGRALAARCCALGWQVRGVDVQADAARDVAAGDITDPAPWAGHLEGCEVVIHTAALVTNNAALERAWAVNVIGTQRVLDAARAAGARRFVFVSTMGVTRFGQIAPDAAARLLPGRPLDERWPLLPVGNSYTDTKIAAEHLVLAAHAAGEIACTIVRPADVYGPGSRAWVLLPLTAMQRGMFLLPNHGKGLFTAIYIDDLVDGIVAAATADAGAGQIFHLGGEAPITTAEYFGHLWRMLGKDGAPRAFSTRTAVAIAEAARLGYQMARKPTELGRGAMQMLNKSRPVSNAKARQVLGWSPRVDLAEGMRRTEAWLRAEGHLPSDR